MGTRSRIGIQLADDSILSVYHHWDGYPEWLGKTLEKHYNTKESVSGLIDGGDMSCCWTLSRWGKDVDAEEYGAQYYSQRGDDCPPRLDGTLNEFLSEGEEFSYIFNTEGQWVAYNMNQFEDKDPEVVQIPS